MRLIKLAGMTVMATLALTAIVTATASAATLPSILPAGSASEPLHFTGSSEKVAWGDGLETFTSEKSTSTSSGNAAKSGTFNILLEGSRDVLGTACTGLNTGEVSGSISVSGTFHVVNYDSGGKENVGDTFLLKTVHFSCGSSILIIWRGCVAGAVTTPVNTLSKTLTVELAAKSGDNVITTVLNEGNTAVESCEFKAAQNEGEFKLGSIAMTNVFSGFKKLGTAEEILVMPL